MKRAILFICSMILVLLSACTFSGRSDKYTSPEGTNTIKLEYDMASRPSVIYKGKTIWEYPNSGFNEEVYFEVTWEDEDTILLTYDDSRHDGKYAEEFEIDLVSE